MRSRGELLVRGYYMEDRLLTAFYSLAPPFPTLPLLDLLIDGLGLFRDFIILRDSALRTAEC